MYKLVFFVPATHLEAVKTAVFAAGAGVLGHYDNCCWQVLGQGQFRPLKGSRPFIGDTRQLQVVDEYRVELLCLDTAIQSAIAALLHAHPYETPAYDVTVLHLPA